MYATNNPVGRVAGRVLLGGGGGWEAGATRFVSFSTIFLPPENLSRETVLVRLNQGRR